MRRRVEGTRSVSGQPMTTFEYLTTYAANLPPEQIVQIGDDYGDNIFRYFGIAPQRVQQLRQELRNKEQSRG